jgi:hypothetical protein
VIVDIRDTSLAYAAQLIDDRADDGRRIALFVARDRALDIRQGSPS